MNHLTRGTPLITAHTLPEGDYRSQSLLKGAEISNFLNSNGITLEMLEQYIKNGGKVEASSTDTPKESEVAQ